MHTKRFAIAIAFCGLALAGGFGAAPVGAADNLIQTENAREGSWDWQRAFASPAPAGSIDGYLGAISAAPGDTVAVYASTQPAATFRVEVFRIGWYGGVGGRLLTCAPGCSTSVQGSPQSTPAADPATGLVRANWPTSTSFTVGSDWVSGYYVVNFVITSGPNSGKATWTPLVVTPPPDRPKQILVQASVTTWEAYNNWGGKSLYDYNSTGGVPAAKVSFNRPFLTDGNTGMYDWEVPFVRWLEREGYDVAYTSDIDTHRNPALLQGYRLVMVNGHDEYWSTPIRNAFESAKGAGTNLAFFGANIGYWHVRFEDGDRTMVAYKDAAADPTTDPSDDTVQFRDLVPARPECSLIGVQFMNGYSSNRTYTVVNAALTDPWMAGTGFTAGSTIPGVVGYEWDTIVSGCASGTQTVFFSYPGSPNEQLPAAHATRTVAPSGATVFSTGTMDWALKIDPWSSSPDSRVEIFTRNALASLLSGGSPPPPDQPPTVSVMAPASNATVSGTVSVTASASDDVGVAGVQFKLDGVNLGSEDTSSPYSVSWNTATATNGQHTLTATARDAASQTTTSTTVTVTVSNSAPPPSGGTQLIGSASAGDNGWEEALVFNLPQLQSGDQIVVGVQAANDASFVIPTGWTVVTDYRPSTSWDPRIVVLRRAAVAGESTVTIPTGYIGKTAVAIAYRGLDPTAPVIATTTASVGGTSLTVPGLTPGVAGARLVFFTAAQGQSTAAGWTPPAGMTEVGDVNTLQWIGVAADEQLLIASTATGTRTAVFGQSSALSGVLVALRPASP
jgi:hypothetical protein